MRIIILAALIMIPILAKDISAQECQRINESSLSPCRAVQDIQLEEAEFNVKPVGDRCYPQLILHGDLAELHQAILDKTVERQYHAGFSFKYGEASNDIDSYVYHVLTFYRWPYPDPDNFELLLGPNSYIMTQSFGYTKNEVLTNSLRQTQYQLTDQYWIALTVSQSGLKYHIRSNKVGGPKELLAPENEFLTCVRELERREQAIALERSRVVQRAAIEAQLEIHTADRDFYVSEITHYQEAIEILKPIIQEANRIRDEALAKAEELQAIYKEHLELIKTFWDDTESAYGDYFNRLIDSQVEINQTVTRISESIESVEQMQADINKLIADAKTKADAATKKIAELGGSDDQ